MQRFFLVAAGVAVALLTLVGTAEARFGRRGCSSCGSGCSGGGCYTSVDTGKGAVQGPVQGPKGGSPSDAGNPPPPPPSGGATPPPPPPPGGGAAAEAAPAAPVATTTASTNYAPRRMRLFRR